MSIDHCQFHIEQHRLTIFGRRGAIGRVRRKTMGDTMMCMHCVRVTKHGNTVTCTSISCTRSSFVLCLCVDLCAIQIDTLLCKHYPIMLIHVVKQASFMARYYEWAKDSLWKVL